MHNSNIPNPTEDTSAIHTQSFCSYETLGTQNKSDMAMTYSQIFMVN